MYTQRHSSGIINDEHSRNTLQVRISGALSGAIHRLQSQLLVEQSSLVRHQTRVKLVLFTRSEPRGFEDGVTAALHQ